MTETNILVVEDEKEDALLIAEILKSEGYKVWGCESGPDAVRLAKSTSFAVILSELHMEEMSGEDLIHEVTKISPNTVVIMMTSLTFIDSAVEAMEAGAFGYVSKPFKEAEIKIVLKRAIERFNFLETTRKKEYFAELSVKDGLTGLYNRRYLDAFMRQKILLAKETSQAFSVLMIDLDHFKKYNDTNGHSAGDELLSKVSELFEKALRESDVVFRYGGEEFMVYLDCADRASARLVAERILKMVSLYLPVTVSIGIGMFPDDGNDMDTLFKNADRALYKAKEGGRNQVCDP